MSLGLLLDTSNDTLRVALAGDEGILIKKEERAGRRQSELLVPTIKELLSQIGKSGKEITYVVCGKGPGSYTGVRIGLTVAKTIALSLDIPLYLPSSLFLLKKKDKPTMCFMDARNDRSYVAIYKGKEAILQDSAMENDEALEILKVHPEYEVGGDVSYLGLENPGDDVISNLLEAKDEFFKAEALSARPVYLKEHYDAPRF